MTLARLQNENQLFALVSFCSKIFYTLKLFTLDSAKHNSAGYTSTGEYGHNLTPHTSMLPQHQNVT